MGKTKELSKDKIVDLHKGLGYKKISKIFNIPRDTIGSIIRKFKTYRTAANLPGRGRKPTISSRALSNLVRTAKKNCKTCFSGNYKIKLFGHTDQRYKNTIPIVKHEGGSLMMWGCFSEAGTGNLDRVPGIMDSQKYQVILKKNMMPSVDKLNLGDHWIFQHAWLGKRCWSDLKKAVAAQKPSNITELEAFAHEEWAKIPIERRKKLVSTYRKLLLEVIKTKGRSTRY
uniref:Sleeping Beauty transposase HTH domain-containing protein n=1 Tax=Monopterus albus TaxID=43700 RepID=A0A3Q3JQ14_MONAL